MSEGNMQLVKEQNKELTSFLESPSVREAVSKVSPKHLTPERLTRVAITAIMSKPDLLRIIQTPKGKASLLNGLMKCSQAGLEPDGRMAHFIPFGDIVQVIFDYKGLVVLAKRNGIDAKATLVRERDEFEYIEDDGSGRTVVHHKFDPFKDRGAIIGAYSRAVEKDKAPDYEFMSLADIEATRARSRASGNGPWVTDYGEMCRKTPLRRHSKRWELQPEIRDVINSDDDTPPPLNAGREFTRPVFSTPAVGALAESVPTTTPAPEQQPQGRESPLVVLSKRLEEAKITPAELLDYCGSVNLTQGDVGTVAEMAMAYPALIDQLNANWPSQSAEILKRKGGK